MMTLKSELKNLDTTLQDCDLDILIGNMLANIGSTDPELRDSLIYNAFGKLIVENHLTIKQMNDILEVCLSNLFLFIGQIENDTVFTRSFSALVIVQILIKDMENKFLTDEILLQTIEASIKYLKLEEDTRGFVDGKGWAHSMAHGADLLTVAIRHSNFQNSLSTECLEAVKLCLFKNDRSNSPYIDEEEERLIFAVEALQEKGISNREIGEWVVSISDQLADLLEKEGHSMNFFRKKNNVINFLRAYYFRLLYKNGSLELREIIVTILNSWHKKMYNN